MHACEPAWWMAAAAQVGLGLRAASRSGPRAIALSAIPPALLVAPNPRRPGLTGSDHEQQPGRERRKSAGLQLPGVLK